MRTTWIPFLMVIVAMAHAGCNAKSAPVVSTAKTITVEPQEVFTYELDGPERAQAIHLEIDVGGDKVEAFGIIGPEADKLRQQLLDDANPGQLPDHPALVVKGVLTKKNSFKFDLPKGQDFTLLLRNRAAKTVTVNVSILGEFK